MGLLPEVRQACRRQRCLCAVHISLSSLHRASVALYCWPAFLFPRCSHLTQRSLRPGPSAADPSSPLPSPGPAQSRRSVTAGSSYRQPINSWWGPRGLGLSVLAAEPWVSLSRQHVAPSARARPGEQKALRGMTPHSVLQPVCSRCRAPSSRFDWG